LLGWVPGTNQLLFLSDRDGTRDLWTAAVEGGLMRGSPRMVRRNVGQIQPAGFSRDGSLFYSVSTRWFSTSIAPFDASSGRVDEGSATPLLGSNHSAAWSPDGERLAFLTEPGNPTSKEAELHVRNLTADRERELAPHISFRRISGWSPDGSMILVSGWDESLETEEYKGALYAVDVEGGEATSVLDYPKEAQWPQGVGAVWSADGKAIIYSVVDAETRDGRLVWRDLASGEEREIFRDPVLRGTRVLGLSPSGSHLAFGIEESESEGSPEESRRVYLMTVDIESGTARRLAELGDSTTLASVQWTPDGQYVLFGETRQGDEWWTRVSRVPVSGGMPEHLWTFGEGNWGAWFSLSPDGRRIAFTTFAQESEVWVMENLVAVLRESGGGS
ncbi:MAG: PD40 domain-containing protein, partial [Gemmatimonadetes bacterium]|nr:PD40 domain-containing protein [Gemmatimonadota bacterium]